MKGKRLAALALAVVMAFSLLTVPAGAVSFTDMVGHWARADVEHLATEGIVNGTSATTFSPDDACTRGQVVTFLWRAAGQPEPKTSSSQFADVQDSGAYYYKAVLWAVESGITNGYEDGTFGPDKTCSRGEIVTLLHRAYNQ